ncbi:MAG TPA: cell division protein FtsQ/DivIB [Bauldia sp.]|nr:cell division protein FtsQ/DivIB [Bauldia sp.]
MRAVETGTEGAGGLIGRRKIVLPRFLRRPVRALSRLEWTPPKHAGLKLTVAFLLATAVSAMVLGGHTVAVASALTAWCGLGIDQVEIKGQSETSEVDVLTALALGSFPSIVTLDVTGAKERIESLPWVREATLRKVYPNKLLIEIKERKPFAIWQREGGFALIEKGGHLISNRVDARYADLPMVVGEGADVRAEEFVALMDEFPSLKPKVKAGVLVSGRRWNVLLANGIEIMLPEEDPASALIQAVALDDGHGVFSREIAAIDMRLPSRLVFRLTEEGAKARADILKEREKARKKGTAA